MEEHRKYGGDPDVDVSYQYLSFFTDDDEKLEELSNGYKKGDILSGEMKKQCIDVLQEYIGAFQARRKAVTDEELAKFMTPHQLVWGKLERRVPVKKKVKEEKKEKK